jgi:hypothetical protein
VRLETIANQIEYWLGRPPIVQMCFAYQSKKSGQWGPVPPGWENDPAWQQNGRKPDIGMIRRIEDEMLGRGYGDFRVILIGDSDEDRQAANAAVCGYEHPDTFFASDKSS